jgi:hypothetical protein
MASVWSELKRRNVVKVAVAKALAHTGIEVLSNDESTIGEEPATEGGKGLWQRI